MPTHIHYKVHFYTYMYVNVSVTANVSIQFNNFRSLVRIFVCVQHRYSDEALVLADSRSFIENELNFACATTGCLVLVSYLLL